MTFWALSCRDSLRDMCCLFEHAQSDGCSVSPICFGSLLLECEQRGLSYLQVEAWRELVGISVEHGDDSGFKEAARYITKMFLAKICMDGASGCAHVDGDLESDFSV
eukprot:gnl/TRDRNA2_/TRDRNA2_175706_c17_seq1.p1 gnl/TRDRNA2_/TRDRNA2_175706_c17~~gnl/TRDRNA2_/TRDRNA2_175706_c17_seq1.p1  ORF type:complete len:107 (-),score=5.82 gnl/TRDRNA2_/TRDRNA2_175706_c17_seq1:47-367(-)